jgi:hypothetical protein
MDTRIAEVTLHIDEDTSHGERESFRNVLLAMDGVVAAACHDEKPHLMLIEYMPGKLDSIAFVDAAKKHGLHAELIGL